MKKGRSTHALALLVTGLLLLVGTRDTAALPQVTAESSGELYAGQISPYTISVSAPPYTTVTLLWEVAAKKRLLGSGEYRVEMDKNRQLRVELPIETPALKRGHHIAATLTLYAVEGAAAGARLVHGRELSLYGPEPLAREADAFQRMGIRLYDPSGTTVAMFNTAGIPHMRVELEKLQQLPFTGLLVIGAGLDLERKRDKGAWLHHLAAKGWRVLLLDPIAGSVTFAPAQGELSAHISSIHLDRAGATPFLPSRSSTVMHRGRGLALRQRRGASSIEVSNEADGRWSWFSLAYGDAGGLIAIAMWPFTAEFANHPALSLALGRLLHFIESSGGTEQ